MINNNYIIKHKKCKHLTEEDRTTIYVLLNERLSKVNIAKELGISRSTLYYELKSRIVEQKKQRKILNYTYSEDLFNQNVNNL